MLSDQSKSIPNSVCPANDTYYAHLFGNVEDQEKVTRIDPNHSITQRKAIDNST